MIHYLKVVSYFIVQKRMIIRHDLQILDNQKVSFTQNQFELVDFDPIFYQNPKCRQTDTHITRSDDLSHRLRHTSDIMVPIRQPTG